METTVGTFLAATLHPRLPILLIIGIAVFMGSLGARAFQKMRIPQVVGYIAIGLLLGRSGLGLIKPEAVESLRYFNFFALGVIGFMIGGELHREIFQKHGKKFLVVLLAEGLGAFVLVGLVVGAIAFVITGDVATSAAIGIVLGAIASATAPAATVDVLWEYKTRGPLTTAVFAIVALDDGLALVLYGIAVSIATKLTGGSGSVWSALGYTAYELLGAVAIGMIGGVGLNDLIRRMRDPERTLTVIIGALGIVIGLAVMIDIDLILAAMALGVTVANLAPRRSRESFEILERFAPPIYVLFFVIVGARLNVSGMVGWMWVLAVAYVAARTVGKMVGATFGARWAHAHQSIRKYMGLCLFSQAGVAIGLAILSADRFEQTLYDGLTMGDAIIMIVTATTFLVQIIGPPCVKVAVEKAGEVGLNVTEEDLVKSYAVGDVMDRTAPNFPNDMLLADALPAIADTDAMTYPVVNGTGRLCGIVTIDELKKSFGGFGLTDWLLTCDVMQPVSDKVTESMLLQEALTRMRELGLEYMPVVAADDESRYVGMLELRAVNSHLSREILRRRQQASD